MTFSSRYDSAIEHIESRLSEAIDDGQDLDLEKKGDVLNIEFPDGEKIVITPQTPLEQLWVSANYSGHRFDWKDETWTNEKGGEKLSDFLARIISEKLGSAVSF